MTRSVLVLLCLVALAVALLGMRSGWRNRSRRQSALPALPEVPALGTALLSTTGLYVGSTFATSWQDRVVHGGLGERADATATLHPQGVLIVRQGSASIFVPAAVIDRARLAPGLAGKVMGAGGLLVVRWRLGDTLVDSGFRADDKTAYPQWVQAINSSNGKAIA